MSIDIAKTMQHVAIAGHAGPRELPLSVIEHGYEGLWEGQVKPALDAGCRNIEWYGPFGKGEYGWEFDAGPRMEETTRMRMAAFEQVVRRTAAYGKSLGLDVEQSIYGGNPATSPTFLILDATAQYEAYEKRFWDSVRLALKLRLHVIMDNALAVVSPVLHSLALRLVEQLREKLRDIGRSLVVENGPLCWDHWAFADYPGLTSNTAEADKNRPCPPGKRCIMYDQAESWQRGYIVDATERILELGYVPAVAVHKLVEAMKETR